MRVLTVGWHYECKGQTDSCDKDKIGYEGLFGEERREVIHLQLVAIK